MQNFKSHKIFNCNEIYNSGTYEIAESCSEKVFAKFWLRMVSLKLNFSRNNFICHCYVNEAQQCKTNKLIKLTNHLGLKKWQKLRIFSESFLWGWIPFPRLLEVEAFLHSSCSPRRQKDASLPNESFITGCLRILSNFHEHQTRKQISYSVMTLTCGQFVLVIRKLRVSRIVYDCTYLY